MSHLAQTYIDLQRRLSQGSARRSRLLNAARMGQNSLNQGGSQIALEQLQAVLNEQRTAPEFTGTVPQARALPTLVASTRAQWNTQQAELRELESLIRQAVESIQAGDTRYAWGKLNQAQGNLPGQRRTCGRGGRSGMGGW